MWKTCKLWRSGQSPPTTRIDLWKESGHRPLRMGLSSVTSYGISQYIHFSLVEAQAPSHGVTAPPGVGAKKPDTAGRLSRGPARYFIVVLDPHVMSFLW